MSVLTLFEFLGITLYFLSIFHALRNWGRTETLSFFIPVTVYSWFLEEMGVLVWRTYFYNPNFLIFVDKTPIAITFGWAAIMYTGFTLVSHIETSHVSKAFFVALYAVLVDLGMDVIAFNFKIEGNGFWEWIVSSWSGLNLFGVPATNYAGWFLVVFWFIILFQSLKNRNWISRTILATVLVFPLYGVAFVFMYIGVIILRSTGV